MGKIKILIVSNSQIYALGLFYALAEDERIDVFKCTSCSNRHVIDTAGKIKPDIVLIDAEPLNHDGIRVSEILQGINPEIKVIVFVPPENVDKKSLFRDWGVG